MQHKPPRRAFGPTPGASSTEANIGNAEHTLEGLLLSIARGSVPQGAWERLHDHAVQSSRLSEVGLAFDAVAHGHRLRAVPQAAQAEFLYQAGRFFSDVIGDELGAIVHLERALALLPSHAACFAKLEQLLRDSRQHRKLAELYAGAAAHKPRSEQAALLRRAAEELARTEGSEDRVTELLQQVMRLDPGDEPSRARLEAVYVKTNRVRDIARLNEQALTADPGPDPATRRRLLGQLVEIYADKLGEPERALPHVEQLLAAEPTHGGARRVAERLVAVKGIAGRAASALATAYEAAGTPDQIAYYLSLELENTRGPKRAALLVRLGKLRQDRTGDLAAAFDAFEQALSFDPDSEARNRYVSLALVLGRHAQATKTLTRLVSTAKDTATRARAGAQLGEILLAAGDVKRAKASLGAVLTAHEAPPDAVLAAASQMRRIVEDEGDTRALCEILEQLATLESDSEKRELIDEQLAELAERQGDTARAVAAYERLLATGKRGKALAVLERLYEKSGNPLKLAQLLEQRASDAGGAESRALLMKGAAVRALEAKDPAGAIATCRMVIDRFGAARDVLALLIPLLEQQRAFSELASALASDAAMTAGVEHAQTVARLGLVRLVRLQDARGAIAAFEEALAFDAQEKTARAALEKLAAGGDHRLEAARVLEPVCRREGNRASLVRVLEVQGALAPDTEQRLAAMGEAADLVGAMGDPGRALEIAARGLAEAVDAGRPLGDWLKRVESPGGRTGDAKRRAAILTAAIGNRTVESHELWALAKSAGEALAESGDVAAAIDVYRRALAFEPHSNELLSRVDDLLRDQGSPAERVELYRTALPGADPARRRMLLHRIGGIERHDLGDVDAAIATFCSALADDPDDADAAAALEELYAEAERWGDFATFLELRVARSTGDVERSARARLAEILALQGEEARAAIHCHRLLDDPEASPAQLDTVIRAGERLASTELLRLVFERRAAAAGDPREQVEWIDRLGHLERERRGDPAAAANAWKRAGQIAEANADEESARRLYAEARRVAPSDGELTARLISLCERAELWSELPDLYVAMARHGGGDVDRVELALQTARVLADRLGDSRSAAQHAQNAFELAPARTDVRQVLEGCLLGWARAEEAELGRPEEAIAIHRRILELDAECDEAWAAVARLALAAGDTAQALWALRSRRERAEGAARVATELAIAETLVSRTDDWQEALQCLRGVLAESPVDPLARALVTRLLQRPESRPEAAALLESVYEAIGDSEAREHISASLLEAPLGDGDRGARTRWFERLCDLQRDGGRLEAALATAVRGAGEMPEVESLWARAEDLARAVSKAGDVARLYRVVLSGALAGEHAATIGERAARFYEEWFDDPSHVASILDRVIQLNPAADWAFDRLRLMLDADERWDDLFAVYDRALLAADEPRRSQLLEEAAQTAKDFADRPDKAVAYLERLWELRPTDAKLATVLERLYERQGQSRDLVRLLSVRLSALGVDQARRTRLRIASLCLDALGDAGGALDALEPALGTSADADAATASSAWRLLERVLDASSAHGEKQSSVRARAAALLREHYVATGRDADLARMLLIELESVESETESGLRRVYIAELFEGAGDLARATEQLGLALVVRPSDVALRDRLVLLAERTGLLDRLATCLAAAAAKAESGALRVALTTQAATLYSDRLGDERTAIDLLASVLAEASAPRDDVLAAAQRLDPLLERAGRDAERLDVLERIADLECDGLGRREALARGARLATALGRNGQAIAAWERRLAADPRDAEALDGLVDLVGVEGPRARLAELLRMRSDVAPSVEARRADLVRVAELTAELPGGGGDAIVVWRAIEQEFGTAPDSSAALEGLLSNEARWEELCELLEQHAAAAVDTSERGRRLAELGDVRRERLGALDAAVTAYGSALASDVTNARALEGLWAIARATPPPHGGAVAALHDVLRRSADWPGLVDLTPLRLAVTPAAGADADRIAILMEAADIAEIHARDAQRAFDWTRRAFACGPVRPEVRDALARRAAVAGAWADFVVAHRDAIAAADERALGAASIASLLATMAGALEEHLGDAAGALATYLQVIDLAFDATSASAAVRLAGALARWDVAATLVVRAAADDARPFLPEVLDALERAAATASAWDAAAAGLESAAGGRLRGEAARDVHGRAGSWYRDRTGDLVAAEAAFELAVAEAPRDVALLEQLADLRRRRPDRRLVDTLLALSEARGGALDVLHEAAALAREALVDRALARAVTQKLLELARARWEADPEAARDLARWGVETLVAIEGDEGDAGAVVAALEMGDSLPFPADVRRDMRRRAAHVAFDGLRDEARGIALYEALFDEDPRDPEVASRLSVAYAAPGRRADLLRLRQRELAAAIDPHERLRLRLETAPLLVAEGQLDAAIGTLRDAVDESPRERAAAESLTSLLERAGRTSELRDLLGQQAELAAAAGDTRWAADAWARAARETEVALGDPDGAAALYERVVALEPRGDSFEALARLATARGDHDAAAAWLDRWAAIVDPVHREDATLRLASALVSAGRVDDAIARLEGEIAAAPDADRLRDRLADVHRTRQDWTRLAEVTAQAAEHAPDQATRLSRLIDAARLFADDCALPARAIPLLEQATDFLPDDQGLRLKLADALAQAGRYDDARTLLQSLIDAFGGRRPKERAPVHHQ
ncbi:MAG: tetratricopeptide repeat protein, partial [Polyangiaceae bacterium]|nr:tetratricopeptide repeat protein [Polyangiaceae bacterium]